MTASNSVPTSPPAPQTPTLAAAGEGWAFDLVPYKGECTCSSCCKNRGESFVNCPRCGSYKLYASQQRCSACSYYKLIGPETYHQKETLMPLSIDPERVKKAAADCPDAKRTLETLFPEVFEKVVDLRKLTAYNSVAAPSDGAGFFNSKAVRDAAGGDYDGQRYLLAVRTGGPQAYKGFALDTQFLWSIVTEPGGQLVLVPSRKDA